MPRVVTGPRWQAWLTAHMDACDMTAAELARAIGKDPSTVGNWVRGKDRPRPETVPLIAQALDIDGSAALRAFGYLPGRGLALPAPRPKPAPPDPVTLLEQALTQLRRPSTLPPGHAHRSLPWHVPLMAVADAHTAAAYLCNPAAFPEPTDITRVREQAVSDPGHQVLALRIDGPWLLPLAPEGTILHIELHAEPGPRDVVAAIHDGALHLCGREAVNGDRVLGVVIHVGRRPTVDDLAG